MADQPGQYGFERRDEVRDPNAGNVPSNVNLLPVPGISRGASVDLTGMTREAQELVNALGNLEKPVSDLFQAKRADWRLQGQLAYTQGVTEEELAKTGNFYTVQGHRLLSAQTAMLEWYQNKQDAIVANDHTMSPDDYRKNLMSDWDTISKSLPDDKLVRQLASSQSADLFPRLMQEQTKAHNGYNLRTQRNEWTNNLVAAAGVSLQGGTEGRDAVAEKAMQGASGLPPEMENDALADAIVLDFQAGRRTLYDTVGGVDGAKGRNFDAALMSKITTARNQFEDGQQADFARSYQEEINSIVGGVSIDGNVQLAQQRLDDLYARVESNGAIYGYAAEQTTGQWLSGSIPALKGMSPEQARALSAKLSDPDNKRALTNLFTSIRTGQLNGDQMAGNIRAVADQLGVGEQDVSLILGEFDKSVRRIHLDGAAAVKKAAQTQLDKMTTATELQGEWQSGSMGYSGNTTPKEKQGFLDTQMSKLVGTYQGAAAAGQQFYNAKGQPISPVEKAEAEMMKPILAMNMVWESAAKSMQNDLTVNVVDPKTGAVNDRAVQTMDLIHRMTSEYGANDSQIKTWLGGDETGSSYAARLYYMTQSLDEQGLDTPSALRQAQMILATKKDVNESTLRSKEVQGAVQEAATKKFDGLFSISGRFARASEASAGGIGEMISFGLAGRTVQERERIEKDPVLNDMVTKGALTEYYKSGGTITWDVAASMAADDLMGRGAVIGSQFVASGYGRSIQEDMFANHPEISGSPDLPHFATLLYLRDHASAPVEQGGFGKQWNEWKLLGDQKNDGIFDGKFWANLGPGAITDQLRQTVHNALRGAPEFRVMYDYQSQTLHVWDYDDQNADRTTGRAMVVPIKYIGDAYAKWAKSAQIERNEFWKEYSPTKPPFVEPRGSGSATEQTPKELLDIYNRQPRSDLRP
mgnify:CR=1 FL=1